MVEKLEINVIDAVDKTTIATLVEKIVKDGKYKKAVEAIKDVIHQPKLSA